MWSSLNVFGTKKSSRESSHSYEIYNDQFLEHAVKTQESHTSLLPSTTHTHTHTRSLTHSSLSFLYFPLSKRNQVKSSQTEAEVKAKNPKLKLI